MSENDHAQGDCYEVDTGEGYSDRFEVLEVIHTVQLRVRWEPHGTEATLTPPLSLRSRRVRRGSDPKTWRVHYDVPNGGGKQIREYATKPEAIAHARDIAGYEGVTNVNVETTLPSGAIEGTHYNERGEIMHHYHFTAESIATLVKDGG